MKKHGFDTQEIREPRPRRLATGKERIAEQLDNSLKSHGSRSGFVIGLGTSLDVLQTRTQM